MIYIVHNLPEIMLINFPSPDLTFMMDFVDDSYKREFMHKLLNLQENSVLTDVTLRTDGRIILCHKLVLCAASPYFKGVFHSGNNTKGPSVVELGWLSAPCVHALVKYMYTGEIKVRFEDAMNLIQASILLQIDSITKKCEDVMIRRIEMSNCIGLNRLAKLVNLQNLIKETRKYMQMHFKSIITTQEFTSLTKQEIIQLVSDDMFTANGEHFLFRAVVQWTNAAIEARREMFPEVVSHVNLHLCPVDFLRDVVQREPLMANPACQKLVMLALRAQSKHDLSTTLLVMGGFLDGDIPNNKIWWLDEKQDNTGTWKALAIGIPEGNCEWFSACWTDQGIIVSGGRMHLQSTAKNECWFLEKSSGRWKVLTPMKWPRYSHKLLLHENAVFALGGYNSECLDSVEKLDLNKHSWSNVPPMMKHLGRPSAVSIKQKIYVLGGQHPSEEATRCSALGMQQVWSQSLQEFDPVKNEWTWRSSLPEVCPRLTAVGFDDKIYAVVAILKSCFVYKPLTDSWYKVNGPSESHFTAPAVAVWKGRIVVFGGQGTQLLEEYDPEKDSWSKSSLSFDKQLSQHQMLVVRK